MSLGKKYHVVERAKLAGSGVMVHRIHPSVGRFKHHGSNIWSVGERVKLCNGCAVLTAAYAQSIAPVCSYGVFNIKVLEKARCAAK